MNETADWTRRVDQMTGATVHEQLRTVVRDAEEMLNKFTSTAYEHGGLLLDAQRETELSIAAKIDRFSADVASYMDTITARLAAIEETQRATSALLSSLFEESPARPTIAAAS
ncbi:MAG: hypothetical protein WAT66_13695 [Actinomycetota bacterium]